MADSLKLANLKKQTRDKCLKNRRDWAKNLTPELSFTIAKNFLKSCDVKGKIVSGFLPIGSEVDVRVLLQMCLDAGAEICLPCVVEDNAPLIFRAWRKGDELIKEKFGTKAPLATAQELVPDILITPMLAFDNKGYRLGYGGGFYDRTFAKLRAIKQITGVGVALSLQKIDSMPIGQYDTPLDIVITEDTALTF